MFLQETWLAPDELPLLSSLHTDFFATGSSAIDPTDGLLKGRPHGGLAILWRKTLDNCKIIDNDDCRSITIEISNGTSSILLMNIYMPVAHTDNIDDYIYYLSKFKSVTSESSSSYVAMFGDLNTNIRMDSAAKCIFTDHLYELCQAENYVISDHELCDKDSFTFFSASHNTVSWIDHLISNESLHNIIEDITINDSCMTMLRQIICQ